MAPSLTPAALGRSVALRRRMGHRGESLAAETTGTLGGEKRRRGCYHPISVRCNWLGPRTISSDLAGKELLYSIQIRNYLRS